MALAVLAAPSLGFLPIAASHKSFIEGPPTAMDVPAPARTTTCCICREARSASLRVSCAAFAAPCFCGSDWVSTGKLHHESDVGALNFGGSAKCAGAVIYILLENKIFSHEGVEAISCLIPGS